MPFDLPVFLLTLTLLVFGLIMLYSASYVVGIYRFNDSLHYIKDQAVYAVMGLVVMLVASKVDYHIYKKYAFPLLVLVLVLLVVVLFMPEYKGCNRWITIKNVGTFQPSEIAKFSVILLFANMIEKNYDKMKTLQYGIIPFVGVLGIIVTLMIFEPHLSGIVIICGIGAIMMFVGGSDIKWFALGIGAILRAVVLVIVVFPETVVYAKIRIDNWLHPEADLKYGGYQSYQSLLAIGSGGLFGLGLGNGMQKHLHLPESQNDFIFSVICEELGFFGGMMVILLFAALFLRGFYVAVNAKDKFGGMLAVGISTQIGLQAFLNIAVATGTIPNTGISLPFFSEGGTSLLMLLGEVGILLSVSRYANIKK